MKPWSKALYETDKPEAPTQHSATLPWSSEVSARSRNNPRDSSVSPTVSWYHTENGKRRSGLENEIDIADIKAAIKGVKNGWFAAARDNPKIFANFKDHAWEKLLELKNGCKL